jgi:hypothetical protein
MILNSTIILAAVIIGYPIWKLSKSISDAVKEHQDTMRAYEEER